MVKHFLSVLLQFEVLLGNHKNELNTGEKGLVRRELFP